jgi:hypothetical protein
MMGKYDLGIPKRLIEETRFRLDPERKPEELSVRRRAADELFSQLFALDGYDRIRFDRQKDSTAGIEYASIWLVGRDELRIVVKPSREFPGEVMVHPWPVGPGQIEESTIKLHFLFNPEAERFEEPVGPEADAELLAERRDALTVLVETALKMLRERLA